MYTLTIKGFTTQEQVEQFAEWYCGSGEQSLHEWFACTPINTSSLNVDCVRMQGCWIMDVDDTNLDLYVKPHLKQD